MEKGLTKKQKCVLCRSEIEVWLDEEKANEVASVLNGNFTGRFIRVEGRTINVADISGIFSAQDLEEVKRRKMGQWKCNFGLWHGKGETCLCTEHERQKRETEEQKRKEKETEITLEEFKKNREEIERVKENLKNKLIL